jgi:DNA repair protein RadD
MKMLRDYQQRAIDDLYTWFSSNATGNPCLEMPTGSGKSHVVAELCKNAVKGWPDTRILMLTHSKELISQNATKMRQHWPNAPLGVWSAGLGRKEIDQITFAGIQSAHRHADSIGHRDLILVDECHLISNKEQGTYRKLLGNLAEINPNMRVIGLTATPYRLGQGTLIDGADALFKDIIRPVTIQELIARGFLATLKSKHTNSILDISNVHKRGGEYIESELNRAVDQEEINRAVVAETIVRAGERKKWLFFCSGVDHAEHVRDELLAQGISAACVTGGTSKAERSRILAAHEAGEITALTNANVLTTGYDSPDIDLLVYVRPTLSPALYVQMAGRGMRVKSHTDHCLVLDFAGNVERHGPITNVRPPKAKGDRIGEIPTKICPQCDELVQISVMRCPDCGYIWEEKPKKFNLSNADIMGIEPQETEITEWKWSKHTSSKSGKDMVKVVYYSGLAGPAITEYFAVTHDGYAGGRARAGLATLVKDSGLNPDHIDLDDMSALAEYLNTGNAPDLLTYTKNGRFYEIHQRYYRPRQLPGSASANHGVAQRAG